MTVVVEWVYTGLDYALLGLMGVGLVLCIFSVGIAIYDAIHDRA